jgi:cytochrome P450
MAASFKNWIICINQAKERNAFVECQHDFGGHTWLDWNVETHTLELLFDHARCVVDNSAVEGAVAKLDDNLWVLSSHEAVHQVLRHPSCSSDERRSTNTIASEEDYPETIGDFMLFMDPPDHTRLRRLVSRAFTPRQVKFIEPRAETIVADLLERPVNEVASTSLENSPTR